MNRKQAGALLLVAGFLLLISGCGFQLRGKAGAELPASLAVLRVSLIDNDSVNAPLLVDVRNALRNQAGVKLADSSDTKSPQLILFGERSTSRVLSVSTSGKVSAYLLDYQVSFKVIAANGKQIGKVQTIRQQRDYTFNPLNVLAKEREERFLARELRRGAVQQLLRRLTLLSVSE